MPGRLAAVVVIAALAAPALAGAAGEGIRVIVVACPTCPVETVPPSPGCAATAVAASVRVYRRSDGHTVARVRTGADGRVQLRVRPGRYAVSARPSAGGPLPRCPQGIATTVRRGRYTRVAIMCDSGVR